MVKTYKIKVQTKGNCHVVDLTSDVRSVLSDSGIQDGAAVVFNVGSTAAITTLEFEPGLGDDVMAAFLGDLAPANGLDEHEKTWNDDNGPAHIRASLLGPSLSVPVIDGELSLGTWQQIVLVDFDTRARERTIVCQIIS